MISPNTLSLPTVLKQRPTTTKNAKRKFNAAVPLNATPPLDGRVSGGNGGDKLVRSHLQNQVASPNALAPLNVEELALLPRWYSKYFTVKTGPVLVGRRGVHGDGSCFFHAVCVALNTENYLHVSPTEQKHIGHVFRCNFNNHITNRRWKTFLKKHDVQTDVTFEKLKQNFCTNHFWADELMIKLVSDVLRLDLIFLNGNTGEIYCGVHGKKKDPMIVIMWIKESHFEPVFCIRYTDHENSRHEPPTPERLSDNGLRVQVPGDGSNVKVQFKFTWEHDSDIINSVLNNYRRQCSVVVT